MKIKSLMMSLLAVAALSFTACSQEDNAAGPASLNLVSAQPTDNADGIWVKPISWLNTWNVSFTLTFDDEVVIKNENPQITLVNVYDGASIESKQFETVHWTVAPGEDAKSVEVKLVNEEGNLIGLALKDEAYKITVPAGIISNVAGTASNQEVSGVFYSSAVAKEREGLPTELAVASTLPADADDNGIWQKPISWLSTWNVEFVVTFNEKVVVKAEKPEGITLVNTYNGKSIEEKSFEETAWVVKAGSDEKSVIVRLESDGKLIGVVLKDEAYKLTIPAGIVTNVAGTVANGQIVKTVYSSQAAVENNGRPTALTVVSTQPEDYDEENNLWTKPFSWASNWNINFVVTFDEDVKIANDKPEGITLLQKGTNKSIIEVKNLADYGAVHWVVEAVDGNSKAVRVRLLDEEGNMQGTKLEDEAYKLTIPASIITNTAGNVPNGEIVKWFYSSEAAKAI